MKVIAIERDWSEWTGELTQALETERVANPQRFDSTVIADSAIVRPGMPLFVPDFAGDWEVEIVPAVVISRLGKSIPARFAGRYYKEIGVMGRLLPTDGSFCHGVAASFDGALCAGLNQPMGEGGLWSVSVDGNDELTLGREELLIDETIALVSRYMMLKTGDVILPCHTGVRVKAEIGSQVRVTLNGVEAMKLKIK